jgi:hypothetical protein
MTTLFLFLVEDKVWFQTFNCCVKNATEANQIVATVKFITKKWVAIVAMVIKLTKQKAAQKIHILEPEAQLPHNALEQLKKGSDVKNEQPILMAGAIFIKLILINAIK